MARAQAFVFDAYGTLFDVHSVVVALKDVTADAESVSMQWRAKQLEYSWLRSLMGRYVDFWTVTDEALQFALKRFGIEVTPAQHAAILNAYLHLSAYPEIPATLAALAPRPCLMLSNGAPHMLEAAVTSSGLGGKIHAHLKCRPGQSLQARPTGLCSWYPGRLGCRRRRSFSCHRTPSM